MKHFLGRKSEFLHVSFSASLFFSEASARLKARIDDAIKTLISAASQCSVPTMNDAMSVLREKVSRQSIKLVEKESY